MTKRELQAWKEESVKQAIVRLSLINGDELHEALEIKYQTWMKELGRPDVQKAEWIRGVMWGIRIAQREVLFYINRGK